MDTGYVVDFDAMEKLWHHTFAYELRVASESQALVMTDSPLTENTRRERMAEVMLETFNVPAMCVNAPPSSRSTLRTASPAV